MRLDADVDAAYPARWIGKVVVETTDGRRLEGRIDEPKGDPGNTLDRAELEDKALRLAAYRDGASEAEMRAAIRRVWSLADAGRVGRLLPRGPRMTPRSYLFVPADRPERYAKALAAGADAVIVDLEDAVGPDAKDRARERLERWLAEDDGQAGVVVRVNAADTAWFEADLRACRSPRVGAVLLPKAERVADLERAGEGGRPVLALIESAAGIDAAREIARAPGVERLVFGSIDFQADLGISGEGEELLAFRSQLVLASRLGGLAAPVDGVSTAIDDEVQLEADARRARRLGFGAKLCIHPKQAAVVNRSFTPGADEIAWAHRVLDAYAAAGGAAVAVDGKMIDKPVVLRAQSLLRQASR